MSGISVAVCCYNGKQRLEPTLRHLLAQTCNRLLPWEVLLIDNGSTDGSAEHALSLWPADAPAPLRVVREPRRGHAFARMTAFEEARHPFVFFVDDDNWLDPAALAVASEVMVAHPEVGACGGEGAPVFDAPAPAWFSRFSRAFAVGAQARDAGYVDGTHAQLYGAGLVIRTSAIRQLLDAGYDPLLTGRAGSALSSGDDTELCFALRLAGWRMWYEPSLRFLHEIGVQRLQWPYLRDLYRAFGESSVRHDAYLFLLANPTPHPSLKTSWIYQTAGAVKLMAARALDAMRGDEEARVGFAYALGRTHALLRRRGEYVSGCAKVRRLAERLPGAATGTAEAPFEPQQLLRRSAG